MSNIDIEPTGVCALPECEIRSEALISCPGCGRGYCSSHADNFIHCDNCNRKYCARCLTRGAFCLDDEELLDLCIGCNAAMERANEAMAAARR